MIESQTNYQKEKVDFCSGAIFIPVFQARNQDELYDTSEAKRNIEKCKYRILYTLTSTLYFKTYITLWSWLRRICTGQKLYWLERGRLSFVSMSGLNSWRREATSPVGVRAERLSMPRILGPWVPLRTCKYTLCGHVGIHCVDM